MKTILKSTIASLGVLFAALAFSSCADNGGSTHEMGPPGKSRTMSDEQMPSRN